MQEQVARGPGEYLETIQALPADALASGLAWLERIITDLMDAARRELPSMDRPSRMASSTPGKSE